MKVELINGHLKIGPYQILWCPRRRYAFFRGTGRYIAYRWVLFVWPIEVRRIHPRWFRA